MLGENIKNLRKNKGLTQEELAIRLNVVRQTVSKWEKGFSVPDAELLKKLADILDTDVSTLLGSQVSINSDINTIAEQLSRINEQLAIKNRRWNKFWKIIGIVALIILVWNFIVIIFSFSIYNDISTTQEVTVTNSKIQ